jgi:hypothetical protein
MTTVIDLLKERNQNHLIECIQSDKNLSKIQSCYIQDKLVVYVEFKNEVVSNIVMGKKRIIRFFNNKYEKILNPV